MALDEIFCALSDKENIFSCVLATSMTSPKSMRNNLFAFNVMIYVNGKYFKMKSFVIENISS